ncbi:peptide deformylase, mitochondrial-like [Atheta coriaria]|uniref:peptide deformylase, mitochondrial-like n=1 Tax=Dalotia coriaria TaxID=877792 RepID=UPI0031F3E9A4
METLRKPRRMKPPYKHVVQIGDPTLRQTAEEVPTDLIDSKEIQTILHKMKDVYTKYNCCGLSAPQVGVSLRIIMVGMNKKQMKEHTPEEIKIKQIKEFDFQIFINPVVKVTDYTKILFPESCESVRGFWAEVPRYQAITLQGHNEIGKEMNMELSGWMARIVQHEMDHLNGKLYTDIMDRKTLTCGCWDIINERNGGVILPYRPK